MDRAASHYSSARVRRHSRGTPRSARLCPGHPRRVADDSREYQTESRSGVRGPTNGGERALDRTSRPDHLVREPLMSATLVETLDIPICSTENKLSPARAEASQANGRLSRGPT